MTEDEQVKALARMAVDFGDQVDLDEHEVDHLIHLLARAFGMGRASMTPDVTIPTDPPVRLPYRGLVS